MFRATLILLISFMFAFAQYEDPTQFFPMQVGNKWFMSTEYGPGVSEVTKMYPDSTGKIKVYFGNPDYPTYTLDSNLVYLGDGDILMYILNADSGDGWSVRNFDSNDKFGDNDTAIVTSIFEGTIFGVQTKFMSIGYFTVYREDSLVELNGFMTDILAYGFGRVYTDYAESSPDVLQGCVINGVEYGYVGIEEESNQPQKYVFRNYPNPFNLSTKIILPVQFVSTFEWDLFDITGKLLKSQRETRQSDTFILNLDNLFLPTGQYIIRLRSNRQTHIGKISYIK